MITPWNLSDEDVANDRAWLWAFVISGFVMSCVIIWYGVDIGVMKDIGSTAGTFDILYNPVLATDNSHILIEYVRSKLRIEASTDGIMLGVAFILAQLFLPMFAAALGPMVPGEPGVSDIMALLRLVSGDLSVDKVNRPKLSVYIVIVLIVLADNVSDSFFTVKIDPGMDGLSKLGVWSSMFFLSFLINFAMSELFIAGGVQMMFWSVSKLFGTLLRKPQRTARTPKRKPDNGVGRGNRKGGRDLGSQNRHTAPQMMSSEPSRGGRRKPRALRVNGENVVIPPPEFG